jgi:hypothetical protein
VKSGKGYSNGASKSKDSNNKKSNSKYLNKNGNKLNGSGK